jgi:hypothetical protein
VTTATTLFNPEKLPGSGPWQSYFLFLAPAGRPADLKNPLNLGQLYATKLVPTPKTFYDPGLLHPDLDMIQFGIKHYENAKYPWPKGDDKNADVRGNYMYYPQSDQPAKKTPQPGEEGGRWWRRSRRSRSASRSMVTDMISAVSTRPHTTA